MGGANGGATRKVYERDCNKMMRSTRETRVMKWRGFKLLSCLLAVVLLWNTSKIVSVLPDSPVFET